MGAETNFIKRYDFGRNRVSLTPVEVQIATKTLWGKWESRSLPINAVDPNYMIFCYVPMLRILGLLAYVALLLGVFAWEGWENLDSVTLAIALVACGLMARQIYRNTYHRVIFKGSYRGELAFSFHYRRRDRDSIDTLAGFINERARRLGPPLAYVPELLGQYNIIGRKDYLNLKDRLASGESSHTQSAPVTHEELPRSAKILSLEKFQKDKCDETI